MCVLTKAEETLRIDREGCLMCSIGFMAVPFFKNSRTYSYRGYPQIAVILSRKPCEVCYAIGNSE